tara:strand:+ start:1242 stop:2261 length:1020 start_codon:yes stop_codon:yes gene_type:complete
MATEVGQTDSPQTVEVTDEQSLAQALAQTLELETVPQETPDKAPAEAEVEEGKEDVLSQPEEVSAEDEPAADDSATDAEVEEAGEDEAEASDAEEETPRGVQKRIDKLTKRAKEAEEAAADLKAKLDSRDSEPDTVVTAPVTPENPLAHITKLEDAEKEEHNAEQVLDWCDDNPDGAIVQTSDGEVEYSAEEVRDIRKRASKAIRKWIPQRTQWIKENQQNEEYALKSYKWWNDKASAEYQAANNILREFPEIQRFPDYKVIVGDTLMGMHMRLSAEQKSKTPKKATAPKKAPKQPTVPTSEPAPMDESAARSSSARQRFEGSGDREDLANLIAADFLD